MCSAIVQKTTGQAVVDYLETRFFKPVGIKTPTWGASAQGVSLGGYGLKVTTEDIARLGQVYLQKGQWQGKQLLAADYVDAATRRQTSNGSNPESDWDQGYGFQFWRCRHDAYRGDGAFGQYCIVMPEQDVVIAITSGLGNMQSVLNIVWENLLPGIHPELLPENKSIHGKLTARLNHLSLATVKGQGTSRLAGKVGGTMYEFPGNDLGVEGLWVDFNAEGAELMFAVKGQEHAVKSVYGKWMNGRTSLGKALNSRATDPGDDRVAVSGAWTAENTYTTKLWFNETPYALTLQMKFSEDGHVMVQGQYNVAFGGKKVMELKGQAK
jgi:hypothetical protein